jgi:hypothetical protein
MKSVATSDAVNQAVADLSGNVFEFLCALHAGDVVAPRSVAEMHMHRLRELARETGVALDELPAYQVNITNWRAVARLAGSVVKTTQAG